LQKLQQAEALCRATANDQRLLRILNVIAFVYYSQEKLELALEAMLQGVELSRHFSMPINIGASLNNIGLIQYKLGQAKEALQSLNEAIAFFKETSQNNRLHALGNKALVLAYLGRFPESLTAFQETIGRLQEMGDERGLVDFYLAWGFEYSTPLEEWDTARERFKQAQQLIEARPDSYLEEQARLFIGLGQVELKNGELTTAKSCLESAEQLIETMDLAWWRPVLYYSLALLKLAQEEGENGRDYLRRAWDAIQSGKGCPDYLCLILLELAKIESDESQKLLYLEKCVEAAQRRARYMDRQACLETAGAILAESSDDRLRQIGQNCLALLD
jgi:tetratricopeptide (TPR) repeat protein